MELDHVAITTDDIAKSVDWYSDELGATVIYQDESWAMLKVGAGKIALVRSEQHPAHVGVRVSEAELQTVCARLGKESSSHRDGTKGLYISDPDGNVVELIYYPVLSV